MSTTAAKHSITARQAGDCVKALYLQRTGQTPSEPASREAENRMEAGQAMKDVVSRAMEREGWELKRPGRTVELNVSDHLRVTALPDEVARHPEITAGQWVVVQTGSAKDSRFRRWLKETSFKTYPYRVHQLALLAEGYREDSEPPADLQLDAPQMIVMLNRDTGALEYEPMETDDLEPIADMLKDNLGDLSDALVEGTVPEAPFKRTTRRCQQCQFLTLCHGKAKRGKKSETVTTEQIEAALATIEELYEEVEAAKPAKGRFDRAKGVIRDHMIQEGLTDITLEGEARTWTSHLERDARVNVSTERLRERVSPAIMAEVSTTSHVMTLRPE